MDTPNDPTRKPHPGDYGSDDLEPGGGAARPRDEDPSKGQAPADGDAGSGGYGVGEEGDPVG